MKKGRRANSLRAVPFERVATKLKIIYPIGTHCSRLRALTVDPF